MWGRKEERRKERERERESEKERKKKRGREGENEKRKLQISQTNGQSVGGWVEDCKIGSRERKQTAKGRILPNSQTKGTEKRREKERK